VKWVIKSWGRVRFLNTYLAGTILPRIELDLWLGINCATHFIIVAEKAPVSVGDYLDAGR